MGNVRTWRALIEKGPLLRIDDHQVEEGQPVRAVPATAMWSTVNQPVTAAAHRWAGWAMPHSRVGHEGLHVLIVRVGQQEGLDALLPRPSVGPTVRAADVLQPPPHPPLLVHEALGSMNNLHTGTTRTQSLRKNSVRELAHAGCHSLPVRSRRRRSGTEQTGPPPAIDGPWGRRRGRAVARTDPNAHPCKGSGVAMQVMSLLRLACMGRRPWNRGSDAAGTHTRSTRRANRGPIAASKSLVRVLKRPSLACNCIQEAHT
jgi:hypothetical protein